MHRALLLFALVVALPGAGLAQRITGRVTDAGGTPIPQARVMVRPVGDSSEAALRVAITDQNGAFRLIASIRGHVEISVLRIGFRPDSARRVDLSSGDRDLALTMSAVAFRLASVRVNPRATRCVALDSDQQSPDVRDLVHLAQENIRARRVTERDYGVTVREVTEYTRVGNRRTSDSTYTFAAGDARRAVYEERLAAGPIGRAHSAPGAGGTSWIMPQEGLFLSATFTKRLCFDNTVYSAVNGNVEVRFQQTDATGDQLSLVGSFVMSPDALLRTIPFRVLVQGRRIGEGTLAYENISFDGTSFPFITSHVQQTYIEMIRPGSRFKELWDGGRIAVTYAYSGFVRQRDPFAVADE